MSTQVLAPPKTSADSAGSPRAVLPWWSIAAYPLLWLMGLAFFFWPLLLVRVALVRRPRRIPPLLLAAVPVLLAISMALAVALGETEPGRALSAVYNIVIWEVVVVALSMRWSVGDLRQLVRGIVTLASTQGVVVFVAIWSYPTGAGFTPLITKILPASLLRDPSTQSFLVDNLAFADYYGGPVMRSSGFFGHPNWGAGLAGMATILAIAGVIQSLRSGSRRTLLLRVTQVVTCAVPLQYAYSRTTVVAVILALAVGVAVQICTVAPRRTWMTGLGALTVAAAAAATQVNWTHAYNKFNEPRLGSLLSRSEVYRQTWRVIVHHPVTVLGVGTKERVAGLAASLGTHSTYLGMIYRAGWLAALCLAGFLLLVLWTAARRGQWLAASLVSFVALWSLAEDFDVGHLLPLGLLVSCLLVNLCPYPKRTDPGRNAGSRARWILGDVLAEQSPPDADLPEIAPAGPHRIVPEILKR